MITVSNGVEKFTIRKEMIKKVERGIRVSPDDYYCNIEFEPWLVNFSHD